MNICITKLIRNTAMILLAGAGLSTAVHAATITPFTGFPQPTLNAANDAFYFTGVTISNSSTQVNNQASVDGQNNSLNPYPDIFGATVEYLCTGCYHAIFVTDSNPGFSDTTFFTTSAPKTISGFNLVLNNIAGGARSATKFQLFAGGSLIDTVNILSPGQSYDGVYGSTEIQVSDTFAPVTASSFEAVFVNNNIQPFTGPDVFSLQGIFAPTTGTPEPGTMGLFAAGLLACIAWSRHRSVGFFRR
jgi:hypothetical protein